MEAKDLMAIAKALYAMEKKRKPDLVDMMVQPHRRTWTDEYPWKKPSRVGFAPVAEDQKRMWEMLANKK